MGLDPAVAALLARHTIDKAATERMSADIEWGQVVGWDIRDGVITHVTVELNGAAGVPVYCVSLIGSDFTTGKRVAVWWSRSGVAYVIGTDEVTSPVAENHPYLVADATGDVADSTLFQVVFNSTIDSWGGGETVRPWREPNDGTNPIDFVDPSQDAVTINKDGLYHVSADIEWGETAVGMRQVKVDCLFPALGGGVGNTTVLEDSFTAPAVADGPLIHGGSTLKPLVLGTVLRMFIQQNSGLSSSYSCRFQCLRIAPYTGGLTTGGGGGG